MIKLLETIMLNNCKDIPIGIEKYNGEILLFDNSKVANKGEITIIGDQVSKGYLNASLLDKENFFTWQGKKAYKTGDYGYFNKGYLYFSGRKDSQIKLNGFRIELNEINKVEIGEKVVVIGYPLAFELGDSVKVTTGDINANSGMDNEITQFQFSAPIQMGNSGGPVIDEYGEVIGVVVSKLAGGKIAPELVNFAIKLQYLKSILNESNINFTISDSQQLLDTKSIFSKYKKSVLPVWIEN